MIDFNQALQLVEEYISKYSTRALPLMVLDDETLDRDTCWVFFYGSQKYLETNDIEYAIAGNAPIIIRKSDGKLLVTGTSHPVEYYVNNYEESGDPYLESVPTVILCGLSEGSDKKTCLQALRSQTSLTPIDAKAVLEKVAGSSETFSISASSNAEAEQISERLRECGWHTALIREAPSA